MWDALFKAGTGIVGGLQTRSAVSNAEKAMIAGYGNAMEEINNSTNAANTWLTEGANGQATAVEDAANGAAVGTLNAAQAGGAAVLQSADTANGYLDPYMQAGTASLKQLTDLANGPGFKFSEDDPSYQWRLQQGQKALERSAAARGGALGGGAMKSLTRYAQGAASQEYQAAFDRFSNDRKDRAGMLQPMVAIGATASNQAGQNVIGANKYNSDINFEGEKTAGQFRTRGTEVGAGLRMNAVGQAARNKMFAGEYTADGHIGIGETKANAHMQRANAWNQVLNAGNAGFQSWYSNRGQGGANTNGVPATASRVPAPSLGYDPQTGRPLGR